MIFAVAVFGAILGSFLNALLFRYNTGKTVLRLSFNKAGGRSACPRCGHALSPLDLIPILSFAVLRARCRYCGVRISWQYTLVEAAAAALAVGLYLEHPEPGAFVFWLLVWMTLLFIFVYDLRHKIIPWSASLFLVVLSLVHVWSLGFGVWDFAAGLILAAPLALLSLMSRGRWMGWGDGVLELSLGWLLGLAAGFTALLAAFWSGAFVGIALLCVKRGVTMKSEVPFAPFLIFGAALAHFLHADLFQMLSALFP